MKNLSPAITAASFFSLIGFACWISGNAYPLLALIFTPMLDTFIPESTNYSTDDEGDEEDEGDLINS